MNTRRVAALTFGASAPFLLLACTPEQAAEAPAPAPDVQTSAPADDDTETGTETTETSPTPSEEPTEEATEAAPGELPAEYQRVVDAIALAEAEAGGSAFELDEGDGGVWEVHVAVGDDDIEVEVNGEGTEVLSSEREADLGDDDSAGLAAAGVDLAEAVTLAVAEYGGTATVDDAGISDENGSYAWEVGFVDDIEVYLDITDGSVLRVES